MECGMVGWLARFVCGSREHRRCVAVFSRVYMCIKARDRDACGGHSKNFTRVSECFLRERSIFRGGSGREERTFWGGICGQSVFPSRQWRNFHYDAVIVLVMRRNAWTHLCRFRGMSVSRPREYSAGSFGTRVATGSPLCMYV